MADLPPLRLPGASPREGNGSNGSKFHITIPGGVLGSLAFLLVQLVGVVIWAANEHSQRIELQHQFEEFKTNMRDRASSIEKGIDRLDTNGSRALALVADRQLTNVTRANLIEDRISSTVSRLDVQGGFIGRLDQRLDEVEKKLLLLTPPPKAP